MENSNSNNNDTYRHYYNKNEDMVWYSENGEAPRLVPRSWANRNIKTDPKVDKLINFIFKVIGILFVVGIIGVIAFIHWIIHFYDV